MKVLFYGAVLVIGAVLPVSANADEVLKSLGAWRVEKHGDNTYVAVTDLTQIDTSYASMAACQENEALRPLLEDDALTDCELAAQNNDNRLYLADLHLEEDAVATLEVTVKLDDENVCDVTAISVQYEKNLLTNSTPQLAVAGNRSWTTKLTVNGKIASVQEEALPQVREWLEDGYGVSVSNLQTLSRDIWQIHFSLDGSSGMIPAAEEFCGSRPTE